MVAAEMAGKQCQDRRWITRPLWIDIANGTPPEQQLAVEHVLGEWQHGWQYYASDAVEHHHWDSLLQDLAWPSVRLNAASTGKARLHSCMGRFSAVWLTVCPRTETLTLNDSFLQCAMRRRLGIAVSFDGEDTHGHSSFRDNRNGRLNVRHTCLLAAWRQVFFEAGGAVPDRNVERMLHDTNIPNRIHT